MYKYLFDINYNNKIFSIFLGENNHKAFLESKNGKYYYPLYEDYLYLNNKFNKENFVSFKIDKFNLKEKVMIKSTAVALALITVTTASMVKSKPKYNTKDTAESKSMIEDLLANQPQIYVSENKINSKSDLDKFLGYEHISDEELYNAIDNNNQISKENKEKIYTVINKIKEKSPDFDFRIFYENIKSLNITLMDKNEIAKEYGLGVAGCYDTKKNTIYYSDGYDDMNLYHEICHVLFDYYRNDNGKVVYKFNIESKSLGEAMNCKITNYITFDNSYSYQRSILDFLLVNCPYSLTEYNYNGIGGYKIKLQEEYPSIDFDFIFNLLDSITIVQNDFNMTLNLDKAPAFIEELFNLVKINPDTYPYFKVICEYVNDDVKEMYEQKYNNLMEKQR